MSSDGDVVSVILDCAIREKARRTSGESSASTDRAVRAVDARRCEGKGMESVLEVLA
jgi:hypothetical protein